MLERGTALARRENMLIVLLLGGFLGAVLSATAAFLAGASLPLILAAYTLGGTATTVLTGTLLFFRAD